MRLFRAHVAVSEPFFDGSVLIPSVIARQGLLRRCHRVLEDVILAVQDGLGLDGGLVWVGILGFLGLELLTLLVLDVLVSCVDIYMSGWQSLF